MINERSTFELPREYLLEFLGLILPIYEEHLMVSFSSTGNNNILFVFWRMEIQVMLRILLLVKKLALEATDSLEVYFTGAFGWIFANINYRIVIKECQWLYITFKCILDESTCRDLLEHELQFLVVLQIAGETYDAVLLVETGFD